jgi:hypothetical protein
VGLVIVEGIVSVFAGLVGWIVGLFPSGASAAWLSNSVAGAVGTVSDAMAGFGAWVPFGAAGNALQFIVVCLGISFAIKLVRIVASFLTAGGGSAA